MLGRRRGVRTKRASVSVDPRLRPRRRFGGSPQHRSGTRRSGVASGERCGGRRAAMVGKAEQEDSHAHQPANRGGGRQPARPRCQPRRPATDGGRPGRRGAIRDAIRRVVEPVERLPAEQLVLVDHAVDGDRAPAHHDTHPKEGPRVATAARSPRRATRNNGRWGHRRACGDRPARRRTAKRTCAAGSTSSKMAPRRPVPPVRHAAGQRLGGDPLDPAAARRLRASRLRSRKRNAS